ncbi:hypothetical protein pb186bvf_020130 [Paramecium bursaria]
MNFNISNDDDYENVTIQLNLLGVKAFQIISIEHLDDIELKIQRDQQKNFRYKIIPFYLNNFVKYLNQHNNKAEIRQLEDLHDNIQKDNYSYEVLIKIFSEKQCKCLQLKWIDYLEGQAIIDVMQYIQSKKIRIIYLEKLQTLKNQLSLFYYQPYLKLFNKENYQEVNEKFESVYEVKSKDDLLEDIMPQRKMVIIDGLRK